MKATIQADHLILEVLLGGENFGLGICRAVEERSGGRETIGRGTLYPALQRLEDRGLAESREVPRSSSERGGKARRFYTLTEAGVAAATEQRELVAAFYGLVVPRTTSLASPAQPRGEEARGSAPVADS